MAGTLAPIRRRYTVIWPRWWAQWLMVSRIISWRDVSATTCPPASRRQVVLRCSSLVPSRAARASAAALSSACDVLRARIPRRRLVLRAVLRRDVEFILLDHHDDPARDGRDHLRQISENHRLVVRLPVVFPAGTCSSARRLRGTSRSSSARNSSVNSMRNLHRLLASTVPTPPHRAPFSRNGQRQTEPRTTRKTPLDLRPDTAAPFG